MVTAINELGSAFAATAAAATSATSATDTAGPTSGQTASQEAASSRDAAYTLSLSGNALPKRMLVETDKTVEANVRSALARIASITEQLRASAGGVRSASKEQIRSLSESIRKGNYSEEVVARVVENVREGAARAEETLANARKLFEELGFQVSGTVYEKGADGQWQPGHFTLVGEGHGYTVNYDSAIGASVTYHKTAEDAAPAPEPAKDIAAAKAAEAGDIFAKAAKQVEQYNRLIDALGDAIDRFRQSNYTDSEADVQRQQVQAKLEDFAFESWESHLQLAGFQVAEPLIKLDDQGRAALSQRVVTGHFDGTNVAVGHEAKTGTTVYRYDGGDGWQTLDAQTPAASASQWGVNLLT